MFPADVAARTEPKVTLGKKYHWKIVRKGGHIDWYIDDLATPLAGWVDAMGTEVLVTYAQLWNRHALEQLLDDLAAHFARDLLENHFVNQAAA